MLTEAMLQKIDQSKGIRVTFFTFWDTFIHADLMAYLG